MHSAQRQVEIPAVYMRGGSSKGVFFLAEDLPADPLVRDVEHQQGRHEPPRPSFNGRQGADSAAVILAEFGGNVRP